MAIYRGDGGAGDADNDVTVTTITQKAQEAKESATEAALSASAAFTSAENAATSYDSFDDRYLGAKASDPTLDNDGDALITGALYFNTVSNAMQVYNGTAWTVLTGSGGAELNDLTSAVTWANVPDANITQSSVTQHQAALSITESQVSDLQTYLTGNQTITLSGDASGSGTTAITVTVADDSHNHIIANVDGLQTALDAKLESFTETNDLTAAVTWANVPDANITQSSVTQHQAALSITESQISDLAHYADADVDTHLNTSTATTDEVLSWNGTDYDWVTATEIPDQTGNSGKYLTTDGSVTSWGAVSAGATGGGDDRVFWENDQTVDTDYTITTGQNAMTAGPITVSSGISVTVPSGSTWTIV